MTDPRFDDRLSDVWDAVARGVAAPISANPRLIETVRALHDRDAVPPPDPAFVARTREELVAAVPTLAAPAGRERIVPNGRLEFRSFPAPLRIPPAAPRHWPRWALAQLATAALLIVTLVGSFLAFGPTRPGRQEEAPMLVPAISGTPATPEAVRTETLLDTTVAALPAGRNMVAVDRWRLQPSPAWVTLPEHEGTVLIGVESGAIAVAVNGSEHQLEPGDALDVANHEFSFGASGTGPAVGYVVYVTPRFPGYGANRSWLSGDPLVHASDDIISSSADDLPGGPGRLILERLTVPQGGSLPQQEASPLVWTEVGSGVLGLTLEGDRLPYGLQSGVERKYFQFGREVLPRPAPGTTMTMRNADDRPLVLYRLSVVPGEGSETTAP